MRSRLNWLKPRATCSHTCISTTLAKTEQWARVHLYSNAQFKVGTTSPKQYLLRGVHSFQIQWMKDYHMQWNGNLLKLFI
jgi:hypothetical protein